ncbi:MAG: AbrB/MazE/SpoVT family DNA-binding domain-containing protein [Candidatus Aenigmatarchaeota archaeon]|jgi:AbrB family looped-hinge helix DNA binding protein
MEEKIEDIVKVSPKGQIVIPKAIRKRLGIVPGEKILVISRDKEIFLRKLESLSVEKISERIEDTARKKGIDLDKIISEAVEWARKSK